MLNKLSSYLGPGSFLSICSQAGVKWVSERTGSSNFGASASDLAAFVASILKLHQTSKIERVAEPDGETAWKYSHGEEYFIAVDYVTILLTL